MNLHDLTRDLTWRNGARVRVRSDIILYNPALYDRTGRLDLPRRRIILDEPWYHNGVIRTDIAVLERALEVIG